MRARLKDENGNVFEDFSADTQPRKAMIEEWLSWGARRIASHIGVEICDGGNLERQAELYLDAKDAAAIKIAIKAERSYFPEQLKSERSPYKELLAEWEEAKETLIEAVSEHCGGGGGESVGGSGPLPASQFPPPSGLGEACW